MIKNIVFDVGEVLIGYRWHEMLMETGIGESEATRIGNYIFDDSLWQELDLENMKFEVIVKAFQEKYSKDADIIGWFLSHGERMYVAKTNVWSKVHELKKKGYRIYLLSNYSSNLFKKHTKNASFLKDIDGMVVSYQVHMIKPSPQIYQYFLNQYNLNPEECIFFDDREVNVIEARRQGMQGFTVTSEQVLLNEIEKLLV